MQCYKCGLFTKVFRLVNTDEDKKIPTCLCGTCLVNFLHQLELWKDFDAVAECKYWKTGIE